MAIEAAERTIQDSLDQFHNPKHSSTTCTAGTYIISVLAAHTSKHSFENRYRFISWMPRTTQAEMVPQSCENNGAP